MNELGFTIAPLLRGLTYNGRAGAIVRYCSDFPESVSSDNRGILSLNTGTVDHQRITEQFSAYSAEYGIFPSIVALGDSGFFALGSSYDEATETERTFAVDGVAKDGYKIFETAQRENRNDVVKGKISVVTGAARGFGEIISRHLAGAGAFVVLTDIDCEGIKGLANELNQKEGKTVSLAIPSNVGEEKSVRGLIHSVVDQLGGLDLFINNAGVNRAGSVAELSLEDFEFVALVNYTGYFLCVKYASRVFALQNTPGGGYFSDIIQINSKSGLVGSNKNGAYAGSKFGGIGLTQSFALELIKNNTKVNAICPGNFLDGPLWSDPKNGLFVQYLNAGKVPGAKNVGDIRRHYEAQVPMGRGCTGEDVVKAIFYIVDQRYETGQALPVSGGQIMLS